MMVTTKFDQENNSLVHVLVQYFLPNLILKRLQAHIHAFLVRASRVLDF